ncbi:Ig-like domain-containing protein, partial [Flavobacterium rhizosphaerae]
ADAQTFCNDATVSDLMATGTDVMWYADETGGSPLASDAALATGTYYVSQMMNDCESPRVAVAVTVNVTPAPVADAQTFCNDATVSDLMATGTDVMWYADETGGSPLASDAALATGTYYVSQMMNDCESPRVAVAVTVNVTPAPMADAQTFCNDATVSDLMATGTDVMWYADETGGSPLASDAALATGTYYVSQMMNDCESPRVAVAVTVNVTPAPMADAQTFCGSATVSDLMATGTDVMWYADETSETPLASDATLATGTYYVSQMMNDCESPRTAVSVTINNTPAPTGDAAQTLEEGQTLADIAVDGENVIWYASAEDAANHENALDSDTSLMEGVTYYATQTMNGCESNESLAVTVSITLRTDVFVKTTLTYYPVPVIDVLNLESNQVITRVTLINMLGQVVFDKKLNATTAQVNLSVVEGGNYIMHVTTERGVKTVKIIVNDRL